MSTAPALRTEPHLSISQISTWMQCPRKYRFQQIDRFPWPRVPSSLVFGSAVHAALAVMSQARLEGDEPTLDDLHGAYRVAWAGESKPIEMKDGETPEALDAMARAMLAIALEQPRAGRVLAVEEPFCIELAPGIPPLVGVIDLIEERDGRAVIVEHKTGAQRFTDQRVADDYQPTAYALAALEMGLPGVSSIEDVEVRFHVLLKLKKPAIDERPTRRSRRQAEELREVANAVWTAREAGIFPPNRGWACATCPFAGPCSR
jgi:putative RecB family exonuclease